MSRRFALAAGLAALAVVALCVMPLQAQAQTKLRVFSGGQNQRPDLMRKLFDQYQKANPGVTIDIETGGHVFQLHFTNSTAMIDKGVITETSGRWDKGDIHFGFNVSRVFTIREPKRPKE